MPAKATHEKLRGQARPYKKFILDETLTLQKADSHAGRYNFVGWTTRVAISTVLALQGLGLAWRTRPAAVVHRAPSFLRRVDSKEGFSLEKALINGDRITGFDWSFQGCRLWYAVRIIVANDSYPPF